MGGFNLQDLMSKAKAQYDTLQKKMQETVVEASSGGGTVTAKMDGRKQLLSLRIDPEAVKSGDVEMLQDLVLAAVNEAARKVDGAMQSTGGGMLGGMGIGVLCSIGRLCVRVIGRFGLDSVPGCIPSSGFQLYRAPDGTITQFLCLNVPRQCGG